MLHDSLITTVRSANQKHHQQQMCPIKQIQNTVNTINDGRGTNIGYEKVQNILIYK